jgi:glucuronoarabinoxylan endo-1,4-beta-xylanase
VKAIYSCQSIGIRPGGVSETVCLCWLIFCAALLWNVSSIFGQTIYEAENATLSGPIVASSNGGYSGTGYADYNNATGDYVEFTLGANSAGAYPITFRYANGGTGDRPLQLSVNGVVVVSSLSFPVTGGWATWAFTATNNVTLNAGINTVRITSIGSNGANVDYMLVTIGGTLPPPAGCAISWGDLQQRIDGFGFSSAWCGTLSAAKNNALYGTLGMSLLRIRIDENTNWSAEIANAAAAHSYGAKVLGCPWRAPAYMTYAVTNYTTNTQTMVITTNRFTYLSSNYFNAFALWLNQAANAHNLDYVSVKNEPDLFASSDLNVSADEIRIFCRSNAPAIGRPVTMADAVGFTDSVSDPTLNDPLAATNVTIVSGHFYGGGNRVHTNALAKGKPVWMTEHYLDGGATNFPVCLNFAKEINDAMKNQFSAYIAWWAQDGDTNINLANSSGTILKDGYTLGQFSKFIRPGFYRVGTTSIGASAEISAYKDSASSNYVIVALNRSSNAITQQFNLYGFPTNSAVTPWLTSWTQSLAVQAPITNVGSTFSYTIQPSNIVTFVGSVPPLSPTNLSATPGKNEIDLSWGAVTGASSYNVKRATVSGGLYTVLTNVTSASFSDTNVAIATMYYYVVSAVNVSGESGNSPEVSAWTSQYYTALPLADSYVESSTATSNYGTSTNMLVKNNVTLATRNAYLMFDVHALTNVLTATVTLVPNRVDDTTVKMCFEVASTNWTENGITWNNQPGGTGVFIATNTAAVGVPMTIDVIRAAAVAATNGGLLSIRITQPTNSLNGLIQFCSKEHPTNSWRPALTYSISANTPPILAVISNQTIGAGVTLNITNSATDSDEPVQTLTFGLLTAPTNAVLNTNSGVLSWRPLVTQANTTNPFIVMVSDDGTPSLSATQSFHITVSPLVQPQISTVSVNGGQLVLRVNGASGPDYQIQASTNLENWAAVFSTNFPVMPFVWTNDTSDFSIKFFRILVGPPF